MIYWTHIITYSGPKIQKVKDFFLDRLCEGSTWVGVGTLLTLLGFKWSTNVDWSGLTGLGVIISGFLKILIPDKVYDKQ